MKNKAIEQAVEDLKSVLCDPQGLCCISGSNEDRAIVDKALTSIQAEPQYVDVDSFPSIDPNLFAVYLGQMKIGKKIDKVMIERFFGFSQVISDQHELIYNTPAKKPPKPISALDKFLLTDGLINLCEILGIEQARYDNSGLACAAITKAVLELKKGQSNGNT